MAGHFIGSGIGLGHTVNYQRTDQDAANRKKKLTDIGLTLHRYWKFFSGRFIRILKF